MKTFADIIDLWPTPADLAEDLGVRYNTLIVMRRRNRIDSRHWRKLIAAARARKIRGITLELLAELDEKQAA